MKATMVHCTPTASTTAVRAAIARRRGSRSRTVVASMVFVGTLAVLACRAMHLISAAGTDDWIAQGFRQSIYYPARAFLDGVNPYDAAVYTRTYAVRYFPLYSPVALAVFAPLASLPFAPACGLYYAITIGLIVSLAALSLWLSGLSLRAASVLGLSACVLLSRPGQMNFLLGQSAVPLVIATYVALHYARPRPWLAGSALAFTTVKPTLGIPLALLMLCRRNQRAVARGLGVAVLVAAAVTVRLIEAAGGVAPFVASVVSTYTATAADPAVDLASNWARVDAVALVGHLSAGELSSVAAGAIVVCVLGLGAASVRRLTARTDADAALPSITLVCLTILVGTYHQAYDALLLVLPIIALICRSGVPCGEYPRGVRMAMGALLLVPAANYLASETAIRAFEITGVRWKIVTSLNAGALLAAWCIAVIAALAASSRGDAVNQAG